MTKRRTWGTLLSLITTVIVLFAFCGITVLADDPAESGPEIVASGYCGAEGNEESVSWTLDSNGLLTISGTGKMRNYDYAPWWDNRKIIKKVVITEGMTSIGNSAFIYCTSLSSIDIPNSVTSIGNYVFTSCTSLSSINIPNSVTSIGNYVFTSCTSLTSIDIPNSVTSISDNAFALCTSLTSIDIPNSVTSISDNAFALCTSLSSITIPNSVTSIGGSAFVGCTSLSSIAIPNSVTSIGGSAFSGCTSLTSIDIPNSVTSISISAFENCPSLTSVTIPYSVTSIGKYAFSGCSSLTSVTISNSVTSIGYNAFSGCGQLSEIRLEVEPDVFENNLSSIFSSTINARVYVPGEHYSTYESLFSSFENIILSDLDGNTSLHDSGIHLYGYSLILDGSVGVNFYMKLSDEVLEHSDTAYMKFTVNGKAQIVPVKDLTPNKDGYYIFRCDVVAKEMADEITAQVYLDENNPIGDAYTYSVREYAAYILDHPAKYSVEAIELVKAMLNYGAAAQKYFGYNTGDLANSILPADGQQTSLSVGKLEYYKDGEISPAKVSLSLKSTITLKLYFKTEDVDGVKFEYKKQELKTTVSGEYTIVIIEGIPATNFSSKLSIKYYIGESTEAKTLKYRASNYACIVLKQENGGVITDELKEVLSALHIFSAAAIEYNLVQPA